MSESPRSNKGTMLPRILDTIRAHSSFLVTSHEFADGDGVGSEIALYYGLTALGKRVRVINNEPLNERYRFLDPEGVAQCFEQATFPAQFSGAKAVIVVDNNSWPRLKHLEAHIKASGLPVICLDHHVVVKPFSDLHLYDLDATSSGEVVYEVLKALGAPIGRTAAQAIFTTLCTDSGWFRHSNTTRRTFENCAELMGHGLDPEAIYAEINHRESPELKRLLAKVLEEIRVEHGGVYAYTVVRREHRREPFIDLVETDGFIDHVRTIKGVLLCAVFKEMRSGGVKISLRSREPFASHNVALALGGGGHKHASGVTLKAELEPTIALVSGLVAKEVERVRAERPAAP